MLHIVGGWVPYELPLSFEPYKLVCRLLSPFQPGNLILYTAVCIARIGFTNQNDLKHGMLPPHLGTNQMCHRLWLLTDLVSRVYGIEVVAVQLQHVRILINPPAHP